MAPVTVSPDLIERDVDNVIHDLFQVMVQVTNYDQAGRASKEVLADQIQKLSDSLKTVHASALGIYDDGPQVPEPLIAYVENGRNPDIYTREFVELVRRMNQLARGKMHAFADFRDVLAHEMESALPELRDDVRRVVDATGGPGRRGRELGICGLAPAPQPPMFGALGQQAQAGTPSASQALPRPGTLDAQPGSSGNVTPNPGHGQQR